MDSVRTTPHSSIDAFLLRDDIRRAMLRAPEWQFFSVEVGPWGASRAAFPFTATRHGDSGETVSGWAWLTPEGVRWQR